MAIQINDISMIYARKVCALEHLSVDIGEGVFGLLGQNGAGKTTLMRILATLLEPTSGSISLYGVSLCKKNYDEIKRMIGYLPQDLGLYPNLTVREALDYMGILSQMPKKLRKERIEILLEQTNLLLHANKKIRKLSGGMKRRVGLIQAMLNYPKVLIVDEPTTGLDPEERIRIRNLLSSFSQNRTIIFSTHIVEDIACTCDNICILEKGKVNYMGTVNDLLEQAKGKVFTCLVQNESDLIKLKNEYQVISSIYTSKGIQARFISWEKPHFSCEEIDATMEDAFIYSTGRNNL